MPCRSRHLYVPQSFLSDCAGHVASEREVPSGIAGGWRPRPAPALLIARWARQRARRAVWTEPRPPATVLHHLSPAAGLPGLLRATSHGLPLDVAPFLGGSLTFSLPLVSSSLLEGDRCARTFNNATWDMLGLKCKIQFVRSMIQVTQGTILVETDTVELLRFYTVCKKYFDKNKN